MSDISIETLTVGQMAANCYLLRDIRTGSVIIVDPGEDASYVADHALRDGGKPMALWATHGHFDHIMAAHELSLTLGIPFFIHEKDRFLVARMSETASHFLGRTIVERPPAIGGFLAKNDARMLGKIHVHVMETPGHTPGSVCFYIKEAHALISGDTVFAGGALGRADFSYSDSKKLSESLSDILHLPDDTVIYPGHGEPTTVKNEKEYHTIHP